MLKYRVEFIKNQIHHEIKLDATSEFDAEIRMLNRFPGAEKIAIEAIHGTTNIFIVDFKNKVLVTKVPYSW